MTIEIDEGKALEARRKGVALLKRLQREDGSWWFPAQVGTVVTTTTFVVMHKLGEAQEGDGEKIVEWLRAYQDPKEGWFSDNLDDPTGSLVATCAAWAAMRAAGLSDDDAMVAASRRWIDANGGLDGLGKVPLGADPFAVGALLAYAGHVDAAHLELRYFPLIQEAFPFLERAMAKFVNVGLVLSEALLVSMVRVLIAGGHEHWHHPIERKHIYALAKEFQNPNGSWNDTANQTVLAVAALDTLGFPREDPLIAKGIEWLNSFRRDTGDQLDFLPIGSEVWDTALALDALLQASVPIADDVVDQGVHFLTRSRRNNVQPGIDNPGNIIERRGGWAFEGDNPRLPDCDDAGLAVGALAQYTTYAAQEGDKPGSHGVALTATTRATQWLLGMAHKDGGWGAYMSQQPRRPKGLLFEHAIMDLSVIDWKSPGSVAEFFKTTLAEAGDVSTAGLTGRVLHGLGNVGATTEAPEVRAAVDFLFDQQTDCGAWFGRWITNYLAGTSWVLKGLAAVGVPLDDPHVQKAIAWIKSVQCEDGGWRETSDTYGNPERAGMANTEGPSMPGLTGLVASALFTIGEIGETTDRAVDYLVKSQHSGGSWDGQGWTHVWFPPVYFYHLPSADHCYALEAIGRWCRIATGQQAEGNRVFEERVRKRVEEAAGADPTTPVRDSRRRWSYAGLQAWRERGDPRADEIIQRIVADDSVDLVNEVFEKLIRSDDVIPEGLHPAVREYLEETHTLPDGADPEKIARAQRFFVQHGWQVATILFCSSLPQTYAAARGARVLIQTQGMTTHVRRRVLETAQFVFDVLEPNAFGPEGRGMPAIQKVRLLHAAVRQLTLKRASWNMDWGVPINQHDLAGTLQSFSGLILDGFETFGVDVSEEDAEAWMHLWGLVGVRLGVNEVLIPDGRADGDALMDSIRHTEWRRSEHGLQLAHQLCHAMGEYLPGDNGHQVAAVVIRLLAGDECADILKLRKHPAKTRIVSGLLGVDRWIGHHFPNVHFSLLEKCATDLMKAIVDVQRAGKQTRFRIPKALLHEWNLAD